MTFQDAILFAMKASIMMSVLAIGLDTTLGEASYLFRRPRRLLLSVISMDIVMPLFAIAAAFLLPLPGAIKLALIALSVSPVPAGFPEKAMKMGGTEAHVVGVLVAAAIIAVVFVPVAIEVIGPIFGVEIHMSLSAVAGLMVTTILIPLVAGMAVRLVRPQLAASLVQPLATVAAGVLAVAAVVIVVAAWPQVMTLVGDGTIAVFVAFVLVALAAGHILGGPNADDRTVLAVATATRHPGVAMAIATANFPGQRLPAAAVLLYLLVSAVVFVPYAYWRKHQHSAAGPEAPGHGATG
jgi:BASS family bile acid:Na+ symporter